MVSSFVLKTYFYDQKGDVHVLICDRSRDRVLVFYTRLLLLFGRMFRLLVHGEWRWWQTGEQRLLCGCVGYASFRLLLRLVSFIKI